jgi:CubicO group peptidase (beta-lactamase class C family)
MRSIVSFKCLLLSASLVIATNSTAQNTTKNLDKYFEKLYQAGLFNGNVLVAENGKIIYEKSFGYADYSIKKPNTMATSFPVASITKTFTSTAILQLQEKGKLNITDPLTKYFPDFPYPTITIKQLLSHTSRLPSPAFYRYLDSLRKTKDTLFTNADVIPVLVTMNKPLVGEPKPEGDRSAYAYSNINYYLLALLIEKLSGMPYASYLKKNIFLPAGMENTSLSEFNFGLDKNECREHRYRYLYSALPERVDTVESEKHIFSTYNFKGHGDIVSTLHDLLNYDQALYNGSLLTQNSLNKAFNPLVPGNPGSSGYGLGWSIPHDSTKGKVVLHSGGGLGIDDMFVRNIEKHQTVILFDNFKNPGFYLAMNALKIVNGERVPGPKRSIAKVYGQAMVKEGIPAARKLLERLRKDSLNYSLNEFEMNLLGYQFLRNNMDDKAFEVLKTNVFLFPDNWNSYDSYGEILLKLGKKEEAIKMYEKSIELNPKNEGGKKVLETIRLSRASN